MTELNKTVQNEKMLNTNSVSGHVEDIMRRLRLLEERYSNLRKKSQFTEQNMLKDAKDMFEEINLLNSTITDLKGEVKDLYEKLQKLSVEVDSCVSKTEFNVISKYMDFWQPLNFLTREEAEKLLRK